MGMELSLLQKLSIWALPVILAVTCHEAAHAWVADKLGDPTSRQQGRVSFNPLRHIDPIGTVVLPLVLLAIGGFVFGWAKPVPVDVRNLFNPLRDFAIVAIFGPLANLIMALGWSVVFAISYFLSDGSQQVSPSYLLQLMAEAGVLINVMLMIFNLLPIPPLDGSRIAAFLLPKPMGMQIFLYERYGFIILITLMFLGLFQYLAPPILWIAENLLMLSIRLFS